MVSDLELVDRLRQLLSTSDLNTTTTATVRRKLEEDFGIDLSDRKAFIRAQIDVYLEIQQQKDEEIEEEDKEIVNSKGDNDEEEEEEEEEGEEEEEEVASNDESSSSKRGSKRKNEEVKKRGGGFTKLCSLSPQLQKITGVPELARTEVVKQLWSYIREKNLQDPSNRRNILCDEILRDLFKEDSVNMFQMNKALSMHIWPLDSDGPVISAQKEKPQKLEREDTDEPKRKEKKQKGGGGGGGSGGGGTSGFLAPIPLSDALVKFLGTGERALARSAVVKRIWDYIKQNNLQDPSDKRRIICDEKLKELFDVDTFTGFTVSKLLAAHFIKTES